MKDRTKLALAKALQELLRTKTLDEVRVSELCARCNLQRQSFYYHFQDIYDLLKWMLEQDAIEIVKKFDLEVDYEEAITFVMNYVESNDHLINCAYDSIGHDHIKSFF